jgi:TRAP-type mannitol/chloroaromatic compound transport system permease small subunit
MGHAILWLIEHLVGGVVDLVGVIFSPSAWPRLSDPNWLVQLIYYGSSVELLFVVFDIVLVVFLIGLWRRRFLWGVVRGIEGVNNAIGRVAAWAGLIMVLQQVMIVGLQRVFRVSEITIGPFGFVMTEDLSWFGEELKLYNAMIVALCAAYTFVQGGHVRVDLFYAGFSRRGRHLVDMAGSLFFLLPLSTVIWLFAWPFLWRHLVTPKVAATDTLEQLLRKAKLLRWNVETIGFSPNGFDAYFLFKVLMVMFAGLMFLQAIAFFFRNFLELVEGPEAAGRHLDLDSRPNSAAAPDGETSPAESG